MNKKLIISLLILFSTFLISAADIPQPLQQLGFTQYTLADYKKIDGKEYFTFSDWMTEAPGDTITFMVEDGKVVGRFKDRIGQSKEHEI